VFQYPHDYEMMLAKSHIANRWTAAREDLPDFPFSKRRSDHMQGAQASKYERGEDNQFSPVELHRWHWQYTDKPN
jgi:hypothetical protein